MPSTTFRFDFSTTTTTNATSGEQTELAALGPTKPIEEHGKVGSENAAHVLISKLLHRADANVDACALWNASSKILSTNDASNLRGGNENEEFAPTLHFHSHESINLATTSSSSTNNCPTMDKLCYVIPKHTLSDTSTDLIPGVYEGGLKVWECSIDLCRFLANTINELPMMMVDDDDDDNAASSSMVEQELMIVRMALARCIGSDGTTLELGCGHGLPGCFILRENIRRSVGRQQHVSSMDDGEDASANSVVVFSDFNDFVLHRATIPNAQLNVCGMSHDDGVAMDECRIAQALLERSIFVGGDWMGLSQLLSRGILSGGSRQQQTRNTMQKVDDDDHRLDLILASETTYTSESCEDTAFFMLRHLKVEVGVGLVATKRFYFGVGGGTDLFKAACETLSMSDTGQYSDLRLCVRTIQSYDSGNANIRDLLEVQCRRK